MSMCECEVMHFDLMAQLNGQWRIPTTMFGFEIYGKYEYSTILKLQGHIRLYEQFLQTSAQKLVASLASKTFQLPQTITFINKISFLSTQQTLSLAKACRILLHSHCNVLRALILSILLQQLNLILIMLCLYDYLST